MASANGSPRILSILIPRIAPVLLPLLSIPPVILRSDGEWSDPYDGIWKIEVETGRSSKEVLCRNYSSQKIEVDSIDRRGIEYEDNNAKAV